VRPGVLALQGDFAEHRCALESCGTDPIEVRSVADLEQVDALVIPGGESTTMLKLIDRYELREPLVKHIEAGLPVFGTCAGAIVLASKASDGEPPLGVLDVAVRRNAYGRQRESFEAEVDVTGVGIVPAVFIRAPVFEDPGAAVEVLATWAGRPVAVRSGHLLAISFHPELAGTLAMHRFFLEEMA
jgi:5'-phosphate synthase pdxT subunit